MPDHAPVGFAKAAVWTANTKARKGVATMQPHRDANRWLDRRPAARFNSLPNVFFGDNSCGNSRICFHKTVKAAGLKIYARTIKTPTVIVLAVVVLGAMSVEWKFAASMGAASAIHAYHGTCNGGVGQPYADFIHQLRTMAESGDTNRLAVVLRRADEHSRDIYDVWLYDQRDAYQTNIYEILK